MDLRRDWGVELGQRLRESRWIPAQVELVGRMECRTPDPLYVLDICGRYQVSDRAVRLARRTLSERQRAEMIAYQERGDLYLRRIDADGGGYTVAVPPEMRAEEADAFRALWHSLWGVGAMRRIERKRKPLEDTDGTDESG